MKYLCTFCKNIRTEHTELIKGYLLIPICFLCNKRGLHFENNWELDCGNGWKYLFEKDKFIKDDSHEISRWMYQEMSRNNILSDIPWLHDLHPETCMILK